MTEKMTAVLHSGNGLPQEDWLDASDAYLRDESTS
jgi:hypothetical protein